MLRSTPHRRNRTGLWFAALVIVSLAMLLASRTEQAAALQRTSVELTAPLRGALAGIGDGIAGFFGAVGEIDELRRDNDELRQQLAAAEQRIASLSEAASENAELRELLGVAQAVPAELAVGRVVSRDPSNFVREIGIDAGTAAGIRPGMVAVGAAGSAGALVGTVEDVADDTARVRLATDTRFAAIAIDQATRAVGVVRGQLGGQLVLSEVELAAELAVGDPVVTAGLELNDTVASRFPPGLLVGRIAAVERDANGLTQQAFVQPAIDFDRLDAVLVILGGKD